jgi:hypothetical protein
MATFTTILVDNYNKFTGSAFSTSAAIFPTIMCVKRNLEKLAFQ